MRHRELWPDRTTAPGDVASASMLDKLAELGFAWRDVARMLGVSVAVVQKWRREGGAADEHRHRLACLLAMCDEISERSPLREIALWFEMPIMPNVPVTPIDLYADGHFELVTDHASGNWNPSAILTAYDADWRERFRSAFETYQETDGEMSIRRRI